MTKQDAEKQIGEILKALEEETGTLVQAVEISDLDITHFEDRNKQVLSSVRIKLKPISGRRWQ